MSDALKARAFRLMRVVPSGLRQRVVRLLKPSFTVGASCLFYRDGKVLLVKQSYRRQWGLPGGLLDRNELPHEAVEREVLEEVGIRFTPTEEAYVSLDETDQSVAFVYFEALPVEVAIDDVIAQSPEIERLEWFDVDKLPPLTSELAAGIQRLVKRLEVPD